jgi:hypothetical protein
MLGRTLQLNKLALLLAGACALFFLLASPAAHAADLNSQHDLCTGANLTLTDQGCNKDSNGNELKNEDKAEGRVTRLINDAVNLISIVAGVVAVFMLIYGGFRLLTSSGNPESTKAARNAILYALGGLLIIAFAQVIVKFVINKVVG